VLISDQSHYGSPRSILVRVLLDCADDLLVVETLAVKANLRPAKLPDIRASFPPFWFPTTTLHLESSGTDVAERKNLQRSRVE